MVEVIGEYVMLEWWDVVMCWFCEYRLLVLGECVIWVYCVMCEGFVLE